MSTRNVTRCDKNRNVHEVYGPFNDICTESAISLGLLHVYTNREKRHTITDEDI